MPFVAATGQPLNAVGGREVTGTITGATGRLRLDPDQLDGAIAVFKDALDAVEKEVRWAVEDILARPPANDAVSIDAANAFNRVGYENPHSAIAAWQGAVDQLHSIVEQLEAAKRTIVQADAGNVSNFRAP
jgi:hypothetical protein